MFLCIERRGGAGRGGDRSVQPQGRRGMPLQQHHGRPCLALCLSPDESLAHQNEFSLTFRNYGGRAAENEQRQWPSAKRRRRNQGYERYVK